MNKNLYYTQGILAALAGLSACGSVADREDRDQRERSQGLERKVEITPYVIRVWTDPDTKREYVVVSGNGVAITPRLPALKKD